VLFLAASSINRAFNTRRAVQDFNAIEINWIAGARYPRLPSSACAKRKGVWDQRPMDGLAILPQIGRSREWHRPAWLMLRVSLAVTVPGPALPLA
jgi:hypothetical protein